MTESIRQHRFPYTKLQPPQLRANLVHRPRLEARLVEAVGHHKLTLLAAPAGSGKTVLASTLPHSDLSSAWVALDAADDDLPMFVTLLVAALQAALRDEGQTILHFLQNIPNAHEKSSQLAALLINNLSPDKQAPLVLILDDYQHITDPAIHHYVEYLVEYLPPSLRLVIATRHDPPLPLPRWRAGRQLAEIRLPQLRFEEEETALLLNQRYQLGLNGKEVAALLRQTEGWVAGLQLLAAVLTAIESDDERSDYIEHLDPANRSIFDLLAEEVLAWQPPEIQEFLLQTSILPELTPARCQAVTEKPAAARLLSTIYRRNLFLTALTPDSQDGPFRYHDLFRTFLQQRFKTEHPRLWPELHQRAARVAANSEEKLSHLTSAALWDEAADLLEEMGQFDTQRRFMRRVVVNNIKRLPAGVRAAHPWLLLFVAQYYAVRGQVEIAAPWLEQAAARFQEQSDELGQIEILAARAMTDALDTGEVVLAFRQKVETAGRLLRPDHWTLYHGIEQWHAVANQDWPTLTEHLRANMEYALESGDPGALTIANLTIGPQMLFNDYGLAPIEEFATQSSRAAGKDNWIIQACAQGLLGYIRFWQGKIEQAEQAVRESHRLLEEIGGLAWVDDHVSWLSLTLALTRRAYRAFDDFFAAQSPRWDRQETSASYMTGFLYLQGRSLWLRGRLAEAQAVLTQMEDYPAPSGYETDDEERRLLLSSLVAMSTGDTGRAKRELRQAAALHERVRHTFLLTHPRLTLATLYGRQNRWEEALDELRFVLEALKAQGTPGVILQEGESIVPVLTYALEQRVEPELLQPLLQSLQPDDTIALPNSDQHLTPRESEVLRLLATGATNRAIAEELSITERTVKAHVTRILTKLEATTRTEAVTQASRLGLI